MILSFRPLSSDFRPPKNAIKPILLRNIFLFIRRYFTFISFLAFQGLALWFLFTYNRFYRAKGLGVANQVTGWVNKQYNTVEDFVNRGDETKRVHRMNDSLMNLLSTNYGHRDSATMITSDSMPYDTLGRYQRYLWRSAQVTYSTVSMEKNYIQIDKGAKDGIRDDMGVFSSNGGFVGKVINVSPNFSQVMSLLHVQNRTSALVKKTKSAGTIIWDKRDPRFVTLINIPKGDSIVTGDTIVTGRFSLGVPPGHMIGTVAEIVPDVATNFFILKIKTTANFADLQQVFIVENLQDEEQRKLMTDTQKKVDLKRTSP